MSRVCLLLLVLFAFKGKGQLRGKYCYSDSLYKECFNFLNDSVLKFDGKSLDNVTGKKKTYHYHIQNSVLSYSLSAKVERKAERLLRPLVKMKRQNNIHDSTIVCIDAFDYLTKEPIWAYTTRLNRNGQLFLGTCCRNMEGVPYCLKLKSVQQSLTIGVDSFDYFPISDLKIESGKNYNIKVYLKHYNSMHSLNSVSYDLEFTDKDCLELRKHNSEGVHQKVKYLRVK